jgi:hypothetical protein
MIKLWLTNVAPEATDEDIKALVGSYSPDLKCEAIQREPGDGSRPAAFVAVTGAKRDALDRACTRLNGMQRKGRSPSCTTLRAAAHTIAQAVTAKGRRDGLKESVT